VQGKLEKRERQERSVVLDLPRSGDIQITLVFFLEKIFFGFDGVRRDGALLNDETDEDLSSVKVEVVLVGHADNQLH
jgi:hypothetical protein